MSIQKKNVNSKIAVFAGSFDPFTLGHLDVVERASQIFDTLYVLVAQNESKRNLFSAEQRVAFIETAVKHLPNVKVEVGSGLTVNFMAKVNAHYLVRGVRGAADLDFEQSVAWNNKKLYDKAETVILLSAPEHLAISSSVVREIMKNSSQESLKSKKGVLASFVPASMISSLASAFEKLR